MITVTEIQDKVQARSVIKLNLSFLVVARPYSVRLPHVEMVSYKISISVDILMHLDKMKSVMMVMI